jgi:type II secretory pathway pseudopilin PulG
MPPVERPIDAQSTHRRSRRRGFSLLEMTVVIGIIMLLLTMAVVGYRYVEASAAKSRTRTVLHDLDAMVAELDRTGGMVRLVAPSGAVYLPTSTVAAASTGTTNCTNALGILAQVPANQQALSQMPVKSLYGSVTTAYGMQVTAVADGWGKYVIFVPPGGLTGVSLGATAASGGTITYAQTGITITSPDHRAFWASAGPDGNFANGDDNVYSFEK